MLQTNTLFVGKVYACFDELPSTNDWAKQLIAGSVSLPDTLTSVSTKSKPPEGTLVRAVRQSAGRGQFGSIWESERGLNLTVSCVLYPHWLSVGDQFALSTAVALAVKDVCAEALTESALASAVKVKWPNDIYAGERKICGILIENTLSGGHLQSSVVGIGMNVNQAVFPSELPFAGSLSLAAGRSFDVETLLARLCESLERRYLQLRAQGCAALLRAYEAELLGKDAPRMFAHLAKDGSPFAGLVDGVENDGRLRLRTDRGLERFDLKELRLLPSGPA